MGGLLGGPEMYNVPSKALTAGLPGNSTEKILEVRLDVGGLVVALWALRLTTRGHCFHVLATIDQCYPASDAFIPEQLLRAQARSSPQLLLGRSPRLT